MLTLTSHFSRELRYLEEHCRILPAKDGAMRTLKNELLIAFLTVIVLGIVEFRVCGWS